VPLLLACRQLPRLRCVSVDAVPLTADPAAVLAGLPLLQRASWGGIQLPAADSGVWEHLARLGTRLEHLDTAIRETELPRNALGRPSCPPACWPWLGWAACPQQSAHWAPALHTPAPCLAWTARHCGKCCAEVAPLLRCGPALSCTLW